MGREIKFRAWDKKDKVMIDADAWFFSAAFEPFIDSVTTAQQSFEIMQYTGLKDKNGVEIYEGDIVARYWSDGSVLQQFEVKWFVDKSGYNLNPGLLNSTRHNQQTGMTAHGFVVVGNIYESKELLK